VSTDIDLDQEHDDIMYPQVLPFLLVHAGCIAVIWSGVSWQAITMCVVLYWLRMFAIGAGYHRYFSHRTYSTSRVSQFILAFLAQSSAQKSVLWWAAKHRHHNLNSDTEQDVHSPRHKGFMYSHVSWIFHRQHDATDLVKVSDFASYPELMWLHKFELLPAVLIAVSASSLPDGQGSWSVFSGAPCFCIKQRFASTPSHMFMEASGISRVMTLATIGCWLCLRWVRVGTTIITPTKVVPGKASSGGRLMQPIMSWWPCPGSELSGI